MRCVSPRHRRWFRKQRRLEGGVFRFPQDFYPGTKRLRAKWVSSLEDGIQQCLRQLPQEKCRGLWLLLNGVRVTVLQGDTFEVAKERWKEYCKRREEAYDQSDLAKRHHRKDESRKRRKQLQFDAAVAARPQAFSLATPEVLLRWVTGWAQHVTVDTVWDPAALLSVLQREGYGEDRWLLPQGANPEGDLEKALRQLWRKSRKCMAERLIGVVLWSLVRNTHIVEGFVMGARRVLSMPPAIPDGLLDTVELLERSGVRVIDGEVTGKAASLRVAALPGVQEKLAQVDWPDGPPEIGVESLAIFLRWTRNLHLFRPEYLRCLTGASGNMCGLPGTPFFASVAHVRGNRENHGRLICCPDCLRVCGEAGLADAEEKLLQGGSQ